MNKRKVSEVMYGLLVEMDDWILINFGNNEP